MELRTPASRAAGGARRLWSRLERWRWPLFALTLLVLFWIALPGLLPAGELYPSVRFDRVVFAGSVVRTDYGWAEAIRRKQVGAVLNFVATGTSSSDRLTWRS